MNENIYMNWAPAEKAIIPVFGKIRDIDKLIRVVFLAKKLSMLWKILKQHERSLHKSLIKTIAKNIAVVIIKLER